MRKDDYISIYMRECVSSCSANIVDFNHCIKVDVFIYFSAVFVRCYQLIALPNKNVMFKCGCDKI